MQTDKDKSCSQDRLEKKLKDMRDGKAVAEMITAWTTFVMSGEQPKLGVYATKALAARPGLKKVWDLGKGLLTHKDYIKCPERHVFWSDYGAGAKHMAQLFAKKNKQTTVEMCGAGHFMESKTGANIQYPDLARLICGLDPTKDKPITCPQGWDGAKYFWDRVSTNFALTHKSQSVHVFKPWHPTIPQAIMPSKTWNNLEQPILCQMFGGKPKVYVHHFIITDPAYPCNVQDFATSSGILDKTFAGDKWTLVKKSPPRKVDGQTGPGKVHFIPRAADAKGEPTAASRNLDVAALESYDDAILPCPTAVTRGSANFCAPDPRPLTVQENVATRCKYKQPVRQYRGLCQPKCCKAPGVDQQMLCDCSTAKEKPTEQKEVDMAECLGMDETITYDKSALHKVIEANKGKRIVQEKVPKAERCKVPFAPGC
jgi:hypothetical protein